MALHSQPKSSPFCDHIVIDVAITLYFGTKRRADLENFNKLSLDALSGIVYGDDSQSARSV